jgi:arylsulfatase A-like enzyme
MKTSKIYLVLIATGLFLLNSCLPGTGENTAKGKPNILFIAVDDMNDWIGPLGGLDIAITPNLDRLAQESLTFTNAHCASPACSPSRLSIMSGVEPAKTGKMENEWYDGPQWRDVPEYSNIETLAQFFKNRGYESLGGGKLYHTLAPPWTNLNHADPEEWDFYFPSVYGPIPYQKRASKEVINPDHFMGRRLAYFTWGPIDVTDEKMADYQVVDWARYELAQSHEKPFFLACGIFRPHMPWEVPQKYFDMYPLDEIPDLEIMEDDLADALDHNRRSWHRFVLENNQWKHVIQAYLACISFADAQIGRLLDGLDNSAYRDNTIIVLWADHGMHIGEKENWEKFTLWEESTRVPFFMKVPGVTKAGSRCNQPVSLLNIYPTLAEVAGFQVPEHCDGISLLPQLKDPESKTDRSAMTSYRFYGNMESYSLRGENYRYICYPKIRLEELYDHRLDPGEFNNIAYVEKNQAILEKFRSELQSRVDGLSLDNIIEGPDGYTIANETVTKIGYEKIEDLNFIRKHFPLNIWQ